MNTNHLLQRYPKGRYVVVDVQECKIGKWMILMTAGSTTFNVDDLRPVFSMVLSAGQPLASTTYLSHEKANKTNLACEGRRPSNGSSRLSF